jgi:hypothetical protein
MYFSFDGRIKPVHKQFHDPPSHKRKPAILNALTTQLYVCVELLILKVIVEYGFMSSWVSFRVLEGDCGRTFFKKGG